MDEDIIIKQNQVVVKFICNCCERWSTEYFESNKINNLPNVKCEYCLTRKKITYKEYKDENSIEKLHNKLIEEIKEYAKGRVKNKEISHQISGYVQKYFIPTGNREWEEYTINPMYSQDYLDDEEVEEVNYVLQHLNYQFMKEYYKQPHSKGGN